ncbi:MAG: hypothetical protein ACQKBY_09490, partial [Verrucomicrobiales bacterium]
GYQPLSVPDYLARRPESEMDFRVYLRADNFYSHEFADQERYQSYKLTFRDTDDYLFAYAEKGSPIELGLAKTLQESREGQAVPVLLGLRFLPGGKSERSVLISSFHSPRWAYVDDQKEEGGAE